MKLLTRIKLFIVLIFSLINTVTPCSQNEIEQHGKSHFIISLFVDPLSKFVSVEGTLHYLIESENEKEIIFLLNRELNIHNLSFDGSADYKIDSSQSEIRWIPNSKKIIYNLESDKSPGEKVKIQFSYSGKITQWPSWSANVIEENYAELGLYFPWFPLINSEFTYELLIKFPVGYDSFAFGDESITDGGKVYTQNIASTDIPVFIASNIRVKNTNIANSNMRIAGSGLSAYFINILENDVDSIFLFLHQSFGEIEYENYSIVISNRTRGGGYARGNGVILGAIEENEYLRQNQNFIRYISHELSHKWWNKNSNSWEDWLSESFAEYAALLTVQHVNGDSVYQKLLNIKMNAAKYLPPVWNLERNSKFAERVLYDKGALILSLLDNKIGRERFLNFCRILINEKVDKTENLIPILAELEGKNISIWFEDLLKK